MTSMWKAASKGDSDTLQRLIKLGYDINETGGWHKSTPLSIAAWNSHVDCVCILLDNFADVTVVDDEGETALYKLIWGGVDVKQKKLHEIVHRMLEMGADPSTLIHSGSSPMSAAIDIDDQVVVRLLIKNGFDLSAVCYNCSSGTSETPLMYAITQPRTSNNDILSMVQLLIELGADISHSIGETPLMVAIRYWKPHGLQNSEQMVRFLLDSGVPLSDEREDEQEWTEELQFYGQYEKRTTVKWLSDFATREGKPLLAAMILAEEENRERKSRWNLKVLQDMRKNTFEVVKHHRLRGESILADMPYEMICKMLNRI
jgi:ankyrin repeat protein